MKDITLLYDGKQPWTDLHRVSLAREILFQVRERENKRHLMDMTPGLVDMLDEVILTMTEFLDYEPPDQDGEPPLTSAEMLSAAWKEHLEAHR